MDRSAEVNTGFVRRLGLVLELAGFFVIGPAVCVSFFRTPHWLFPSLWALGGFCFVRLLLDRGFERRRLWNARGVGAVAGPVVARFAVLGAAIAVIVAVGAPEMLLGLPRHSPVLWAVIMVAYPVLSVYPQEVIWRAYFFHRYAPLFPDRRAMIAASALSFALVHVVFLNWVAIAMCAVGGAMFGWTYDRSRSTLAVCLEHALYGCFVFTVGLGRFFYTGAVH